MLSGLGVVTGQLGPCGSALLQRLSVRRFCEPVRSGLACFGLALPELVYACPSIWTGLALSGVNRGAASTVPLSVGPLRFLCCFCVALGQAGHRSLTYLSAGFANRRVLLARVLLARVGTRALENPGTPVNPSEHQGLSWGFQGSPGSPRNALDTRNPKDFPQNFRAPQEVHGLARTPGDPFLGNCEAPLRCLEAHGGIRTLSNGGDLSK